MMQMQETQSLRRRAIAYHEAAHAVAAKLFGGKVTCVEVIKIRNGNMGGHVSTVETGVAS